MVIGIKLIMGKKSSYFFVMNNDIHKCEILRNRDSDSITY